MLFEILSMVIPWTLRAIVTTHYTISIHDEDQHTLECLYSEICGEPISTASVQVRIGNCKDKQQMQQWILCLK